eukprot:TRINITY_DN30155_c0_g1_i1.p2 TRINITY_DN30155_c0_g1~~TRINITY_DN30155_c0_g1_i1.p2  ORF type:complete len:217 (-),score=40.06 TRINITY_DN30155_c0_g1_i1:55-705(-)
MSSASGGYPSCTASVPAAAAAPTEEVSKNTVPRTCRRSKSRKSWPLAPFSRMRPAATIEDVESPVDPHVAQAPFRSVSFGPVDVLEVGDAWDAAATISDDDSPVRQREVSLSCASIETTDTSSTSASSSSTFSARSMSNSSSSEPPSAVAGEDCPSDGEVNSAPSLTELQQVMAVHEKFELAKLRVSSLHPRLGKIIDVQPQKSRLWQNRMKFEAS